MILFLFSFFFVFVFLRKKQKQKQKQKTNQISAFTVHSLPLSPPHSLCCQAMFKELFKELFVQIIVQRGLIVGGVQSVPVSCGLLTSFAPLPRRGFNDRLKRSPHALHRDLRPSGPFRHSRDRNTLQPGASHGIPNGDSFPGCFATLSLSKVAGATIKTGFVE